jgi:hypothetical protein
MDIFWAVNTPTNTYNMSTSTQIIPNGMKGLGWLDWSHLYDCTSCRYLGSHKPRRIEGEYPKLSLPVRPEPLDVKPLADGQPTTAFSQLSIDKKEQLQQLQSSYNYNQKEYDWNRKALAEIRVQIVKAIKRDYVYLYTQVQHSTRYTHQVEGLDCSYG